MVMEKKGSVPVAPEVAESEMVKTDSGITKCAQCGGMYLSAHGNCPRCQPAE